MAKIVINNISSGYASTGLINTNNDEIETHLNDKVLYRDNPTGEANQMEQELDMNSNRVINLAPGVANSDAVTVSQLNGTAVNTGVVASQTETALGSDAAGQVFTLTGITFDSATVNLVVYRNGNNQTEGRDYTLTSPNIVTWLPSFNAGDFFKFVTNTQTTNSTTTAAAVTTVVDGSTVNLETHLQNQRVISAADFSTIDAWLDKVIATGAEGVLPEGTYLVSTAISKVVAAGIKLSGKGVIKATGTNRVNLISFTGAVGKVDIDGITFDGNNIAGRPLFIENTGSTSSTLGDVYIGEGCRCINARNNTPDASTAIGCYVLGGFERVVFEGEVDGVDDTRTSSAVSVGLLATWSGVASDDWIRATVITSKARIKNVKNSNSSVENADGMQCFAPVTEVASLTVCAGALFFECEGRGIKSQVIENNISGPVIRRSLYDGLVEIDLQYAGGSVTDAQVYHEGTRVNAVVGVTQRLSPNNSHCDVGGNKLIVTGSPGSNTTNMVQVFGTDNTDAITNQGVAIHDNKVKGTVDYFCTLYGTNVVDVNVVVDESNWVKTIGITWLNMARVFANRAQLSYIARNNVCEDGCTGATIVASGDLKVIEDYNNIGITPFISTPFAYTIASGVLTITGGEKVVRVAPESGTADTIDQIVMTNYSPDEHLTLVNATAGDTLTYKDYVGGSDNLKLVADAVLTSVNDSFVVRNNGTHVCQVSLSLNGA